MSTKTDYTKAMNEIAKRYSNLTDDLMDDALEFLEEIKKQVAAELAMAQDFTVVHLKNTQALLADSVAQYNSSLTAATKAAIQQVSTLGALYVVNPMNALQVGSTFVIPNPTVNVLMDFSADLIKNISNDVLAAINKQLSLGAMGGKSTYEIMQAITDILGLQRDEVTGIAYRSEMIMRTELGRVFNQGTYSQQLATAEQMPGIMKSWVATADDRTRETHLQAHYKYRNNPIPVDEYYEVGNSQLMYPGDPNGSPEETINCLLPDNPVNPLGMEAISRARYNGPAIKITLSSGKELSVTPNHPILRFREFVPANQLHEGDQVITSTFGQEITDTINSNYDNMPPTIEQIWSSSFIQMSERSNSRFASMPSDFHGDAKFFDGDIDIIRTDGFLRDKFNVINVIFPSNIGKQFDEIYFRWRLIQKCLLTGLGSFFKIIDRPLLSFNSIMGSFDLGFPFSFSHSMPLNGFGLGLTPDRNIIPDKSIPNNTSRYIQILGNRILGFPGQISTDYIIDIKRFDFCGHVYDLQTRYGYYNCNSFIVKNCRCTSVTIHPEIGVIQSSLDTRIAQMLGKEEEEMEEANKPTRFYLGKTKRGRPIYIGKRRIKVR